MGPGRELYVEEGDHRPALVLGASGLGVLPIVGGLAIAIGSHLGTALIYFALQAAAQLVFPTDEVVEDQERLLEEEDIIEARFVQLGRDFQDQLPNRQVPLLSTAPPDPSQVPTERTPAERAEQRERQERPPDAVDDMLARLGDRAQAFAEIDERRDREGDPDGIEEGTEREGSEGDIYRGRLYAFFRRGWTVPTTLSREVVVQLTAVIDVQIGPDLQIVSFSLRNESEHVLFDQSVLEQLARLQAADQRIPPPPEEVADQYIGQRIAVRFHGRQSR